jgi:hypothetical protein
MYEYFGFEPSHDGDARMRTWHASHPQHKHGGHTYTLEQFGLAEGEIRGRFERYASRFGVEAERGAS